MIRRIGETGRLSQAVVHGGIVTTSGRVAEGPDVAAQMRGVLARIDALLAEAGSGRDRLLTAQVWLADMADIDAVNAAWDAWVDPAAQPARVTAQTPMTRPEWRVAVAMVAAMVGGA